MPSTAADTKTPPVHAEQPLILFDIDGVLIPDMTSAQRARLWYREGWRQRWADTPQGRYRVFVNPAHGRLIRRLAADTGAQLAWASTWEDNANIWVGPLLGLPPLPFIPGIRELVEADQSKLPAVLAWTAGRPFAWFDDKASLAGEMTGIPRSLFILVEAATGLTDTHLAAARDWLISQHPVAVPGR